MKSTPHEIASILLKEMPIDKAIKYAEKISQMNVELSADYSSAKEILEDLKEATP